MSSGGHFDVFRSETFTAIKILGVLGDIGSIVRKAFFQRRNPSHIYSKDNKFSLEIDLMD
jgi:hypothetical protein